MKHNANQRLSLPVAILIALAASGCNQSERQAQSNNSEQPKIESIAPEDENTAQANSDAGPDSGRKPLYDGVSSGKAAERQAGLYTNAPEKRDSDAMVISPLPEATPQTPPFNNRYERDAGVPEQESRKRLADPGGLPRSAAVAVTSLPHARPPVFEPPQHLPVSGQETYADLDSNPLRDVMAHPVSTFSVDVDTGSYTNVRRMLRQGHLPPANAVRAEEFINYFDYQYPAPTQADRPFSISTEVGPTPWNSNTNLLRIGLQGKVLDGDATPARNLVFLIDVSGSMRSVDKLDLLKPAMKLLTGNLNQNDRISIVVYAGAAGAVLSPTPGSNKQLILQSIDSLRAGGSTNGGAGIDLAYAMAKQSFIKDGINRVILVTDGDFNVGTTDFRSLKQRVAKERPGGVALTTLGFGQGNINEQLMEQLANTGNGNYYYIDTLSEAHKVLVKDLAATLQTIAADVKIQVEFNPAAVSEYRLIGYENRALRREDFNNDRVDAGEIGAGHRVTALYEIALRNSGGEKLTPLRYQQAASADTDASELAFVRLRYKPVPTAVSSRLIEQAIPIQDIHRKLEDTSNAFRFSAAVSGFAQQLRGGEHLENWSMQQTRQLAQRAKGQDPFGYRAEFIQLVDLAASISGDRYTEERVAAGSP